MDGKLTQRQLSQMLDISVADEYREPEKRTMVRYKIKYSWLVKEKMDNFWPDEDGRIMYIARKAFIHPSTVYAIEKHKFVDNIPFECMAQISACIDAIKSHTYDDYKWMIVRPGDEYSPWE